MTNTYIALPMQWVKGPTTRWMHPILNQTHVDSVTPSFNPPKAAIPQNLSKDSPPSASKTNEIMQLIPAARRERYERVQTWLTHLGGTLKLPDSKDWAALQKNEDFLKLSECIERDDGKIDGKFLYDTKLVSMQPMFSEVSVNKGVLGPKSEKLFDSIEEYEDRLSQVYTFNTTALKYQCGGIDYQSHTNFAEYSGRDEIQDFYKNSKADSYGSAAQQLLSQYELKYPELKLIHQQITGDPNLKLIQEIEKGRNLVWAMLSVLKNKLSKEDYEDLLAGKAGESNPEAESKSPPEKMAIPSDTESQETPALDPEKKINDKAEKDQEKDSKAKPIDAHATLKKLEEVSLWNPLSWFGGDEHLTASEIDLDKLQSLFKDANTKHIQKFFKALPARGVTIDYVFFNELSKTLEKEGAKDLKLKFGDIAILQKAYEEAALKHYDRLAKDDFKGKNGLPAYKGKPDYESNAPLLTGKVLKSSPWPSSSDNQTLNALIFAPKEVIEKAKVSATDSRWYLEQLEKQAARNPETDEEYKRLTLNKKSLRIQYEQAAAATPKDFRKIQTLANEIHALGRNQKDIEFKVKNARRTLDYLNKKLGITAKKADGSKEELDRTTADQIDEK
jgi:hypothetical protein